MSNEQLLKFHEEARKYRCLKCGEQCDPWDSRWRFNGDAWEHHHDYPLGHVLAQKQESDGEVKDE